MATRHEAERRLSRAIDKENAALEILIRCAGSTSVASGDERTIDELCAAAKKWTNAMHERSRAQKGLRDLRGEDCGRCICGHKPGLTLGHAAHCRSDDAMRDLRGED